jgi:hypothetical protein
MLPALGSNVQIPAKFYAVDQGWALTINRTQPVFEPSANSVDVNFEKSGDFGH